MKIRLAIIAFLLGVAITLRVTPPPQASTIKLNDIRTDAVTIHHHESKTAGQTVFGVTHPCYVSGPVGPSVTDMKVIAVAASH